MTVAGFVHVPDGGRDVWNLNQGWRFRAGADDPDAVDDGWELVNLPHGVDGALPESASGGVNFQGAAQYRKRFTMPASAAGRRITLLFEGTLGRARVWVNGRFLHEHVSGFLPAVIDVSAVLRFGDENLVVVVVDNSDDPSFPPGKPQAELDYAYFGGLYRSVHLIATSPVHVTDANHEDLPGGGGVFVRTISADETRARIVASVHVANRSAEATTAVVQLELRAPDGTVAASRAVGLTLDAGEAQTAEAVLEVADPLLWTPESPTLYELRVRVQDPAGAPYDAVAVRTGIRTVELDPLRGLVLNGAEYGRKLIGVNRHQEHAVLGFALPDSLHWRDAQLLRDAGVTVVRSAHYPQSRAFMDACDALGIFVIVNTPGWQFWNDDDPRFEERVYSDIRQMVRRDRNHPCVLMWEPILNETDYPRDFALNAHAITHQEYPYDGCFTAADEVAEGHEVFDVQFGHPSSDPVENARRAAGGKVWFTREWGDNVDDWTAQNSPSRVMREWGEGPQLVQAKHYADPPYEFTSLRSLGDAPVWHIGGTLWHAFDHQRGYHPDPFFGGLADSFRRPKTSYHAFRAHRPPAPVAHAESGPVVFIAHDMSPFSPADVTVFSNCDEVGLAVGEADEIRMPMPAGAVFVDFADAWDFMAHKDLARDDAGATTRIVARGYVDGMCVASHEVKPAMRAERLELRVESRGYDPVADGSDVVTVVATLTDAAGTVRRLSSGSVRFHVFGAAEAVHPGAPAPALSRMQWGEAAALVRMSTAPGPVRVIAEYVPSGALTPTGAVIDFESRPAPQAFLGDETRRTGTPLEDGDELLAGLRAAIDDRVDHRARLAAVGRQQEAFEG